MKRTFFFALLVFGFTTIFAQKAPIKFGKLDPSLVKMTSHPIDSGADAVILFDYGSLKFDYNTTNGFNTVYERITRIKVLSKDGLKYGDFKIPYYVTKGSDKEKVIGLKGYTYNVIDNDVKTSKLQKNSVFDEETTENWRQKKVSFPDVEVGSVIELTYEIRSPFLWNLNTWEFQNELPTVYSEYRAKIPEYFQYQMLQSGYFVLKVNEQGSTTGMISYQNKERTGEYSVKTEYTNTKIDYRVNTYRWAAENIPPFIPEAFVASPSDYVLKMEFELKGTKFPNSTYKTYMGTWDSFNETFVESSTFMKAVSQSGYMKDEIEAISNSNSESEKIDQLVNLIKGRVVWDGTYSKFVDVNLRKAWNDMSGSTADINLMLVAGLRKLGFKADPVLISTRGHGLIREQFAISNQFNSVLAIVETTDGMSILDATDPYLPSYAIPVKCLNGKGWRVSETNWGFVKLNPSAKKESVYQGVFTIDPDGTVTGDVTTVAKGYSAFSAYKNYKQKGLDKYIESIKSNNPTWEVVDYAIDDSEGSAGSFKSNYEIELNENLLTSSDRIYFNPTMGEFLNESPFKLKKREYPVDYAQPISDAYYFKFTLPEGYMVEELPESTTLVLPDEAGEFKYSITQEGGTISVDAQMMINKIKFVSSEYNSLKDFYNQAVQKCSEQIVIKKSS